MKTDEEIEAEGGVNEDEDDMEDDFDLDVEDVKKGACFDNIVSSTNINVNTVEETTAKKAVEEEVKRLKAMRDAQQTEADAEGERLRIELEKESAKKEIHEMLLSSSYYNLTQPSDSVKPNYVTPLKSNGKNTPPYYPQKVLPGLSSPELFEKLEQDTLFFIFYYQQETYQQYLAARQLKGASWRFVIILILFFPFFLFWWVAQPDNIIFPFYIFSFF